MICDTIKQMPTVQVPWNKGKKNVYTKETLKKMSRAKMGHKGYWLGKERSLEDRLKISENRKGLTAREKHPLWKGGISSINAKIRMSFEYKEWRKAVFKRDNWTCVQCGYKGRDVQADHIKTFKNFPELRFVVDNGRTLCRDCHRRVTFKKV